MKNIPDKQDGWFSESQVIDILINRRDPKGYYDLRHFSNLVDLPTYYEDFLQIKGAYRATNILREELGFDKSSKPGDFDIILIPFKEKEILFERTAVFELKVVRPTRKSPSKNPNSMGVTQLKGLIKDGFPLAGLIHISMTESLPNDEKMIVGFHTKPVNLDKPEMNQGVLASREDELFDQFSWCSADNQMKRLISNPDIPKFAGISCYSLDYCRDGSFTLGTCSTELIDFQRGYFNPFKLSSTVDKVIAHFLKFRSKYVIRVSKP